ncbi:MAG: hypothetical protein OXH11_15705, partial [Candidatus Aminicenantes bacterium]|nr:hypothetical protein [Candidatus Aminicenantes bacterium]
AKHLKPCIVRISLKEFSGRVFTLESGDLQERRFPDEVGRTDLLFLPAPLPTSTIERILFRSVQERKSCEKSARDYANVPWNEFSTRTEEPRFSNASKNSWPPERVPDARDAVLGPAQAAGGIMAMLRLMSNRSANGMDTRGEPLGVAAGRITFDPPPEPAPELTGTILAGLESWMRSGAGPRLSAESISGSDGRNAWRRLFWGAVGRLARETGAGDRDDAAAALLDYLGDASTRISSQLRERVRGLQDDLESLTGLGEFRASDLWRKYSTPLARAMSLLFLRRTCAELLEFQGPELSEEDWLAAAVLFGARSGWLSSPLPLRGGRTASRAVSHRMAALSQRMAATGFDLGPAPERPKPLAEWFVGSWSARQRSAALELARKQAWDCIETRVKLGRGDYRLEVARGGVEIVFPGEAKSVDTAVDRDRFLKLLSETPIMDPKIEARVVENLRA